MIKSNFHTHTVFCDGADTPEELVNEAVKKGFFALGFSGHSYFEPDSDVCMAEMAASRYRQCVNLLKDIRTKLRFCAVLNRTIILFHT